MSQLSLLPPERPTRQASTTCARLMVFNTQHAAPTRARRQVEWIAAQDEADLVVLTEVGAGPGGRELTAALSEHGYAHLIDPTGEGGDYRTVIASRSAPLTPLDSGVDVMPHRAPAAAFTIAGQPLALLGLYVPSRGPQERRNQAKRAFQTAVTTALPGLVGRVDGPLVVLGDLNIVEPGHTPHHPVFGAWEYDFYRSFTTAGLTDAYRALHPEGSEHSWFGRSGKGFRFDHAFLTAAHLPRLRKCDYLHEPRTEALSDHSALTLALTLPLLAT